MYAYDSFFCLLVLIVGDDYYIYVSSSWNNLNEIKLMGDSTLFHYLLQLVSDTVVRKTTKRQKKVKYCHWIIQTPQYFLLDFPACSPSSDALSSNSWTWAISLPWASGQLTFLCSNPLSTSVLTLRLLLRLQGSLDTAVQLLPPPCLFDGWLFGNRPPPRKPRPSSTFVFCLVIMSSEEQVVLDGT